MNTKLSASGRPVVVAAEKITKGEIEKALAAGTTHVKFKSNKVQRRMMKQQEKIRRKQEIRENQTKALNKAQKAAKGTRPVGGGIGLAHPHADMVRKTGTAHFIDKDGKRIPVSPEDAKVISKALDAEPEEEDLTGASGPEYRYLQQGEETESFQPVIDPERSSSLPTLHELYPEYAVQQSEEAPVERRDHQLDPILAVALGSNDIPGELPIQTYERYKAEQEGKVFLNLYGDENNYKPFPTVGEPVRADGLVSALRTLGEGVVLTQEEKARLVDIDYVFDKLVYADQGPYAPDSIVYAPAVDTKIGNDPVGITEDGLVMSPSILAGMDLNRYPDLSGGDDVVVKITKIESGDDIPEDIGERQIDSILAEHLGVTEINPFEPESPGNRAQMFSSPLSSVPKGEETQLFQPGLTDKITEEVRNNAEAMRAGLEKARMLKKPTEH